jgi:hypothetical protein
MQEYCRELIEIAGNGGGASSFLPDTFRAAVEAVNKVIGNFPTVTLVLFGFG